MTKLGLLCIAVLVATSHVARADDEQPERHLTIMVAPLRAIIPLGEITVEYAINQKLGASIELGAGQRSVTAGSDTATGTEIEGGAQVRYYALGSFRHGMELGGEILEEYVKFQEPLPGNIVGAAAGGATLGAFVGYKIITHVGFTVEAQLGARYLIVDPQITGQATGVAAFDKWAPLLHINVGWSF
jgi:hypothetical protein